MSGKHNQASFDGLSDEYRRRLWQVIAINGIMFAVEMLAGHWAGSKALQADALDFFADTVTYGISMAVIGSPIRTRSWVATAKGASLFAIGLWILGTTLWQVFVAGVPQAQIMGSVGFLALVANLVSVVLLLPYKDGDANVRSVWLCSRNDMVGNVAVVLAAWLVYASGTRWPDLIVALIMAALFLSSAWQIVSQARHEAAHAD